jgi:excisionase family DNA binding protein
MQTHDILTISEAAALARVSERTLSRYIAKGNGPPVTRMGRRVLFRAPDFAAWVQAFTKCHPETNNVAL